MLLAAGIVFLVLIPPVFIVAFFFSYGDPGVGHDEGPPPQWVGHSGTILAVLLLGGLALITSAGLVKLKEHRS